MASTILILGVALFGIGLAWTLLRSRCPEVHNIAEWEAKRHDVDVQSFLALINLDDERRLRYYLPRKQFHHFQRRRTRLALSFLRLIEENAGMAMSLAQIARSMQNSPLASSAEELIAVALQLRLKLQLVRLYLSAKWLFPSLSLSLPAFESGYRELLDCAMQLRGHCQALI